MNKSSSFYSESYYEKARKQAYKKKEIYRQRNKQLYDQQHQLEILKYYVNHSGRCEMSRYYEMISQQFFVMKAKNIKGSDEYNETSKEFIAKVNSKIKHFHDNLMCDEFQTPQQYRKSQLQNKTKYQKPKDKISPIQLDQICLQIKEGIENDQNTTNNPQQRTRKLDTCNQCPIFIEEYQVNFHKTSTEMAKQSSYWDKLNGNQKLAKFRKKIQLNLKVLKYELEEKCEFVQRSRKPKKPQSFQVDYAYI